MNILFVSAVFPFPLYSGGQIRIYNLLKRLSKHHQIHLFSFIRSWSEQELLEELSFCSSISLAYRGRAWQGKYVMRSVLGSYPFVMTTYDNSVMRASIEELMSRTNIDLIHCEPGYVWPSLPSQTSVPRVVSEHNIEHTVYEGYVNHIGLPGLRSIMNRDVLKLKKWECSIWKQTDAVVTVSQKDAAYIKRNTSSPVYVVPNGVNEEQFVYTPTVDVSQEPRCLFVGNFRWMQNKDAVFYLLRTIWPGIVGVFPGASLRIVGRDLPRSYKLSVPGVLYVDHVEDITQEFLHADILLAPIRYGGGTKYKILEAMASGIIVITTEKGAEGLSITHKKHCYIAKNDSDWVKNISDVITNKELNKKIIHNARALIEERYTWETISGVLDEVWEKTYATKHRD